MSQFLGRTFAVGREKVGIALFEDGWRVHRVGHWQALLARGRYNGAGDRGDVILGPRRCKAGRNALFMIFRYPEAP